MRVIVCIAHVHALLTCVFVFVSLFASGSWSIRNVQVCGECRPCSECVCNNDAIDSSCPPTCQDAPTGLISYKGPCFTPVFAPICRAQCTYHSCAPEDLRYLQGSFYSRTHIKTLSQDPLKVENIWTTPSEQEQGVSEALELRVDCLYHLTLLGNTFTEIQTPVLEGDPAAATHALDWNQLFPSTPSAPEGVTDSLLPPPSLLDTACVSFSRTGVFTLIWTSDDQRALEVKYNGGAHSGGNTHERQVWPLGTECPRILTLHQPPLLRTLTAAPATRATWHGGKALDRFSYGEHEEGQDTAGVGRDRSAYAESLVGEWEGRLVRSEPVLNGVGRQSGCLQKVLLQIFDRDPNATAHLGLYRFRLTTLPCVVPPETQASNLDGGLRGQSSEWGTSGGGRAPGLRGRTVGLESIRPERTALCAGGLKQGPERPKGPQS